MIRRCLCILLVLCLLVSATACRSSEYKKTSGEVVSPEEKAVPQLTILVTAHIYHWMKTDYFEAYINRFKQQYGVKIRFEQYGEDYQNAASDLMAKLIAKGGAELILDDSNSAYKLMQQGAVLNVRGKIPNLDRIYPKLLGNQACYVPVGVDYQPILLRKDMLRELNLSVPDLEWTRQDYYNLRDKWLQQSPRMFTIYDLNETIHRYLNEIKIFDYDNKKAYVNTADMKNVLKDIRNSIYGGQYKLNKIYTYENYYNMCFEADSKEFNEARDLQKSKAYEEQHFRSYVYEGRTNALLARNIDLRSLEKSVMLPNNLTEENVLWSIGFMVNKNGANLELAYEFINGLLNNEAQLNMLETSIDLYPVSQMVEDEIREQEQKAGYSKETMQVKEFMLNMIKNEECTIYELRNEKQYDLYQMLVKDLLKYIFPDKGYSDAELSAELKKLEDKFDIYLNE